MLVSVKWSLAHFLGAFTCDVKNGIFRTTLSFYNKIFIKKIFFGLKCHKISDPLPLNDGRHKWMTPGV